MTFDPENVERQSIDNATAQWFWNDFSNTDAVKASDYDQLLELYRNQIELIEEIEGYIADDLFKIIMGKMGK